ncbi:Poly(A)-specific ribonuclease PARN [Dufourea novaeangliae]|uniref:Poly(A)-specific ribonuclease PARN n=1 Tax=Dufourea novaeangliae TaxID=178035 RepID=A0A154NYA1_DUFNO|nr:Poly(A)-specific ribonuclease PARN [Dufourea novaeangliae]
MDFLLVQFGLSAFTFDTQNHKYSQRSYNFYVFPRPLNRAAPDCRFMCQASSISFLTTQGFDFNKLFKLGIPYLTTSEEEKLVKRLEERQKARDEVPELIPISDDDRPQIEEICTRIDEFLASEAEELIIDKCNAFIRRLVHQEVRVRWPNKLRVESKSDCSGHSLIVQRSGTREEEEHKEIQRREREKLEIKEAVGFSTVLKKIAESGKLIVGHNMLLDICHIIHKFFGPLPETYTEFKSLVHSLFPRILDTKVLCQSQQFKENVPSSNLNVLLERVSKSPFKIPDIESVDGRSYITLAEKYHEAGYDAYITGICFIALCNYLVLILLIFSCLANPSRDHVFHLTFPKEWKLSDISQLFSPFGSVYVSWLSDMSAYVALNRREQASVVIKTLNKATTYKIQKYAEYQASLETNLNTRERKRKLSTSETDASKTEENSISTNGAKTTKDDNGWEVATGKRRRRRKDKGDAEDSVKKKPFTEASWD